MFTNAKDYKDAKFKKKNQEYLESHLNESLANNIEIFMKTNHEPFDIAASTEKE